MTDLTISLIAGGGVFLVAVVAYNKWQEHRARKSVEEVFANDHDDVLMQQAGASVEAPPRPAAKAAPKASAQTGSRQEPTLDGETLDLSGAAQDDFSADGAPAAAEADADGKMHYAPLLAEDEEEDAPDAVIGGLVDPVIDCLIPLEFEGALTGKQILPFLQGYAKVGDKPVHYVGLHENGEWEPLAPASTYVKVLAGVQMASRSGPLNEIQYSELVMKLRGLADSLGAEPDVPDMIDVMANARALHRFVLDHDAKLGINVQSNGAPWAMNTLLVSLEKQGFDLQADGTFVMPDGDTDGAVLFSINTNAPVSAATTQRLTLLLDAPRVPEDRDAFGAMTACAKSLAARLGATVVDDGNQPLSDAALAEIKEQLRAYYGEMQGAEIAAGSNRALRLFS
ncbi:MAG TPA: cell division protein ZipA C-terminal FtsZ-binding domain-containing protein [Burkholderiaceae bacterium]